MSLLNPWFYILDAYREPKLRGFPFEQPTSGLAELMDKFTKTNDIWYCMITNSASLTSFDLKKMMGPFIYQKIKNHEAFLVIDQPFEPFLDCIDTTYEEVVKKQGFPPSQVIFMSNMWDAIEYNEEAAKRHHCESIQIWYFSALEWMAHKHLQFMNSADVRIKAYSKSFINLNRRWRLHRPLLTLLLYHRGLLDKGHISFGPCDEHDSWDRVWDKMRCDAGDNWRMQQIISASEGVKNLPPMYLDTTELGINRAEFEPTLDKFYQDSYFSLVSETTFRHSIWHQNSRFITEKTFKAISVKHPFILVTIPKSLEVLKKLGYKTFHPFINESYDNEMNDNERMLMIVDEVARLCNLSEKEFYEFIDGVKPIIEHNYQVLANAKKFIHSGDYRVSQFG